MKVHVVGGGGGVGESTAAIAERRDPGGGLLETDSEYKPALDQAGFVAPVEGADA